MRQEEQIHCYIKVKVIEKKFALGEARTHNLCISYTNTVYKYSALTDCATRASANPGNLFCLFTKIYIIWSKESGLTILTGLMHTCHSRMLSQYYSVRMLWAAVFRPWPGSHFLRQPGHPRLPQGHHIGTKFIADILSTWQCMHKVSQPHAIH